MSDLKSRGKAIVVIQAQAGEAGYASKAMGSNWALGGQKTNMTVPNKKLTTPGYGRKVLPRIAELSPGTYRLMEFNYRIGHGGRTVENKAGMKGLPLASFTVRAGEVVYLGKFIAATTTNAALFNTTRKFDLMVKNDAPTARAYLSQKSPELAAKMKTRLITISPLFNAMKKTAKKK
ncbi:MAG: hypothetical protein L3J67_06820 [Hyphomicrobiaceae bacterium]|nr:hypothetical protein [Hyphomicrobiaceae bacterium]